jgi:Rps23 Pro-64 3,4-dihydroxylase Tpa1-like proline 4-hydroxylase
MSFIYEIDNTIQSELCNYIIQEYENDETKEPGRVGFTRVLNTQIKKSTDVVFKHGSKWDVVHLLLRNIVIKLLDQYIQYLNDNVFELIGGLGRILDPILGNLIHNEKYIITTMQIQKYEAGDYFKWHIDTGISTRERAIAFILYLNTLDSDSGGETEFIEGKKVVPEAGKMIFFPTTWTNVHRCADIKRGSKYIITGFILDSEPT